MSDIIQSLFLDKSKKSYIIVAKELNGCDSSFITSCLLGHCIKNRSKVLVICMHNSKEHYQDVGVKMSYNLQKNIDSGLIKFCNLGEEFVQGVIENSLISVNDLIQKVKKLIETMNDHNDSVNIIFEGVSHLFHVGYSIQDINKICKELIDITREHNNSFIIFHCSAAHENDETHVLANLLGYKSDVLVEVDQLASGWSTDVSGHITFTYPSRKFDNDYMYKLDPKSSHHLFKLFDRGIKLLAAGTL